MPDASKDLHQTPEATLAEFAAKRDRLVAAMTAGGLAAVHMRRTENLAWLTAGRVDRRVLLPSSTGIASVLVLRSGECFYLAPDNEACRLAEEDFAGLPFTAITAPWHSADFTDQLSKLAGSGNIADDGSPDAASFFLTNRATLVDTEIERYRWLACNTAQVTSLVLQSLEPGVTERTMATRISAGLMERGIEPSVLLMAVDERILRYKHAVAQNAPLERFAMLNLCSRRWGLCTSITRFAHFGPMPQALVDGFAVAAEVNAQLLSATREGATAADLFATAAATYASLGHPGEGLRHHQGGATGYAEREWVATPTGSERVSNRQAFAWNPSVAGGKAEDTVLLRGGDIELLTATPELPILTNHVDGRSFESAGMLVR